MLLRPTRTTSAYLITIPCTFVVAADSYGHYRSQKSRIEPAVSLRHAPGDGAVEVEIEVYGLAAGGFEPFEDDVLAIEWCEHE